MLILVTLLPRKIELYSRKPPIFKAIINAIRFAEAPVRRVGCSRETSQEVTFSVSDKKEVLEEGTEEKEKRFSLECRFIDFIDFVR